MVKSQRKGGSLPGIAAMHEGAQLHLFAEYVLDTKRGCLLRAGQPVHLRPQAYKTLKYLAENRGCLISKDKLIEEVWEGRAVTDDSLVQCLRDVRLALGEEANRYLRNERGRGYIFEPAAGEWADQIDVVKVVVEEEDEVTGITTRTSTLPASMRPQPVSRNPVNLRKLLFFILPGLLAVGIVVATVFYISRSGTSNPTVVSEVRLLAVIPFKPLAPATRDEALEVGMTDALIAKLANIDEVTVRPLGAVRRYGGLEQDPFVAGRELGVEAVLDGTIQRSGDGVGVTARLVNVHDGRQLWEGRFDAPFTDIFSVQDSIAEKVVAALAVKLTGEEHKRLRKHYTENAEAYQLYTYGRFYRNKRTESASRRAIEYFEKAIEKDPGYALAYAGLSEGYIGLSVFGAMAPKEALPKAQTAALKALDLDDGIAESHVALAHCKNQYDRDWSGAEREYRRAIELNPDYADAYRLYSILLIEGGRKDEAFANIRRALEIDPTSVVYNVALGWMFYWTRQSDQAVEQLRKTIDMEPTHWVAHYVLAQVYAKKGMHDEALQEAQKALELSGDSGTLWVLGYVYALSGKRAEAEQEIHKLRNLSRKKYISPYDFAQIYAALGDKERAFVWLERADEERSRGMDYLGLNPAFENLHSDPRFTTLIKRTGR